MTRLEIRPFSDEFLAPRRRAPRGAPSRSPGGRAAAPGQVRERRGRSCRGGGARAERGSLGRRRPSRHARRRLPPRDARRATTDLGSERLGRDRRPRSRGRRGSARPVRRGSRALVRGGPRPPLRARPGDGSGAARRLVAGELRAAARLRDPRGARRRLARGRPPRGGARPRCPRRAGAAPPGPPVAGARSSAAGCRRRAEEELRAEILEDLAQGRRSATSSRSRTAGSSARSRSSPSSCRACTSGLARPEGAALLGWAATRPDVRGSGAGVALTDGRVRLGARARATRRW